MDLSKATVLSLHNKAIRKYGGSDGILAPYFFDTLEESVLYESEKYEFDVIESYCLAVYKISKQHPFMDGNKRTATYVLINCLREANYQFTGRPRDLVYQIIALAQSPPQDKRDAVLKLAYYIKAHLQKNVP